MFALLLTSLIGCAPNDAKVSGDWFVWLAANSSATVDEGDLDISKATVFECKQYQNSLTTGWMADKCEWERGYIGKRSGGFSAEDKYIGGACKMNNGYCSERYSEDHEDPAKAGKLKHNCAGDSDEAKKRFDPVHGSCDVQYDDLWLSSIDVEAPFRGDIDPETGQPTEKWHDIINCDAEDEDCCTLYDTEDFADECEDIQTAEFQTWMAEDGYYGMTGGIDQWRSEALINSEGDLQLTVHVDLGDGQDFRYHFTIDPDFEPVECAEDEDGGAIVQRVDGSNWVDEWSEDEDGYRIYYLNAGAYQVNPADSENWWYLSRNMLSGYGFAKFAAEEFSNHPTDYGNYDLMGVGDGFEGITDRETPDPLKYLERIEGLCDSVFGDLCIYNQIDDDGDGYAEVDGDCNDNSDIVDPGDCPFVDKDELPLSWQDEMVIMAGASKTAAPTHTDRYQTRGRVINPKFQHKVEDNFWRPIDGTTTGLDGWMEVHSSWVRLKHGSKVKDGGTVEGDFQILYDGAESGSRLLVRGEFKAKDLRADRWGYGNLDDAKRKENDTEYCAGGKLQ